MQIIGVYFVRAMEDNLLRSYKDSLDQRVNNLSYYLEQEMTKDRSTESSTTLKEDAERILNDFSKEGEILEVSLIDKSYEVIATSNPYNREVAGKKTTEGIIKRTLLVGLPYENKFFDPERDSKVRISVTPIKKANQETIGAIYVVASMDDVYNQIRTINMILASGTILALGITAFLGVFVARTITHPLSDMRKQAIELAKGNFSRKVRKYGNDEIGQLATTFNYLTRELKEAQSMTEGERKNFRL